MYHAFIGFDPLFNSTPADGTVFPLAKLDAWIASVNKLLAEKKSRSSPRQKHYTDIFAKFLLLATSQAISSFRQISQYWHSEKLDFDTKGKSIDARKHFVFTMPRTATQSLAMRSVSKSFLVDDWLDT